MLVKMPEPNCELKSYSTPADTAATPAMDCEYSGKDEEKTALQHRRAGDVILEGGGPGRPSWAPPARFQFFRNGAPGR
jgi:hypothetical protein